MLSIKSPGALGGGSCGAPSIVHSVSSCSGSIGVESGEPWIVLRVGYWKRKRNILPLRRSNEETVMKKTDQPWRLFTMEPSGLVAYANRPVLSLDAQVSLPKVRNFVRVGQ